MTLAGATGHFALPLRGGVSLCVSGPRHKATRGVVYVITWGSRGGGRWGRRGVGQGGRRGVGCGQAGGAREDGEHG